MILVTFNKLDFILTLGARELNHLLSWFLIRLKIQKILVVYTNRTCYTLRAI